MNPPNRMKNENTQKCLPAGSLVSQLAPASISADMHGNSPLCEAKCREVLPRLFAFWGSQPTCNRWSTQWERWICPLFHCEPTPRFRHSCFVKTGQHTAWNDSLTFSKSLMTFVQPSFAAKCSAELPSASQCNAFAPAFRRIVTSRSREAA